MQFGDITTLMIIKAESFLVLLEIIKKKPILTVSVGRLLFCGISVRNEDIILNEVHDIVKLSQPGD